MALTSCTFALSSLILRSSANELSDGEIKRKRLVAHSAQTAGFGSQTALSQIDEETDSVQQPATAADTSPENYWRNQAEIRRLALETHLRRNEQLHNEVATLKLQLDNANRLLDDSKNLVEVLTELLEEDEATGDKAAGKSKSEDQPEQLVEPDEGTATESESDMKEDVATE